MPPTGELPRNDREEISGRAAYKPEDQVSGMITGMDEKRTAFSAEAGLRHGSEEGRFEDQVDADEILPEYDFRRARPNKYEGRAERLTATLAETPEPEVEQAWFQEAERRRQQLLDGGIQGFPAAEVFARLSAKYRR